ncbi:MULTISPECIES: Sec-independent protein translocase TatB [unclassified Pseudoclavibacter]|uniref:Sec-independent protein translocase TatB n=1 Tax=unclassified Pseudoclavibacter TaxID=2615177 RepID=UPI0017B90CB2|nr:sec-independent protein translocase protein TatB [Pseudoclavibacter sp. JAI123]
MIGIIAAFIIGPDKLPKAAERLADAVKWLRGASTNAKSRMKEEMGDDFADVDWRKLDPRQYDPRRIIRDALLAEDEPVAPEPAVAKPTSTGAAASTAALAAGGAAAAIGGASRPSWAAGAAPAPAVVGPVPFDGEAT